MLNVVLDLVSVLRGWARMAASYKQIPMVLTVGISHNQVVVIYVWSILHVWVFVIIIIFTLIFTVGVWEYAG